METAMYENPQERERKRKIYLYRLLKTEKTLKDSAMGFLMECKENGLSVHDVKQIMEHATAMLEKHTQLDTGLNLQP